MEITILIPCLNEEKTIGKVIDVVNGYFKNKKISYEILVCDNGSEDKSCEIVKSKRVRIIKTEVKGYGSNLINGINNSKGKYVIMGDADMSYDFGNLDLFIKYLEEGYDLVVGNRFKGGIEKGAMPFSHRLGVPFLSMVGNMFFKTPVKDYHCGLRGFKKDSIKKLNLECSGMEFASEMICKSKIYGLKMIEVPTRLFKDQRGKKGHLKTFRDGFRHLKFMICLKFQKK